MLLGGLLVLAFLAEEAFRLIRIPPVLVLIACGVLLGPVTHVLPGAAFGRVAPQFGALADVLGVLAMGFLRQLETGGGLAGLLALGSLVAAFSAVLAIEAANLGLPGAGGFLGMVSLVIIGSTS